jgi:hypothetical protein
MSAENVISDESSKVPWDVGEPISLDRESAAGAPSTSNDNVESSESVAGNFDFNQNSFRVTEVESNGVPYIAIDTFFLNRDGEMPTDLQDDVSVWSVLVLHLLLDKIGFDSRATIVSSDSSVIFECPIKNKDESLLLEVYEVKAAFGSNQSRYAFDLSCRSNDVKRSKDILKEKFNDVISRKETSKNLKARRNRCLCTKIEGSRVYDVCVQSKYSKEALENYCNGRLNDEPSNNAKCENNKVGFMSQFMQIFEWFRSFFMSSKSPLSDNEKKSNQGSSAQPQKVNNISDLLCSMFFKKERENPCGSSQKTPIKMGKHS